MHKHGARYLVVVPRPMPAAPRSYLILAASRLIARGGCLSRVLDHGAEAVAHGATRCASQVLDRGAEAVAHGAARCASHIIDRGAKAGA